MEGPIDFRQEEQHPILDCRYLAEEEIGLVKLGRVISAGSVGPIDSLKWRLGGGADWPNMVFDCADLCIFNETGYDVFMMWTEMANRAGRVVCLAELHSGTKVVLDMLGTTPLFELMQSRKVAEDLIRQRGRTGPSFLTSVQSRYVDKPLIDQARKAVELAWHFNPAHKDIVIHRASTANRSAEWREVFEALATWAEESDARIAVCGLPKEQRWKPAADGLSFHDSRRDAEAYLNA